MMFGGRGRRVVPKSRTARVKVAAARQPAVPISSPAHEKMAAPPQPVVPLSIPAHENMAAHPQPAVAISRSAQDNDAAPPQPSVPISRPAHEAIHEKLVEEYRVQHNKDPSGDVWYRLLEAAKSHAAAQVVGKRRRTAKSVPDGFVQFGDP